MGDGHEQHGENALVSVNKALRREVHSNIRIDFIIDMKIVLSCWTGQNSFGSRDNKESKYIETDPRKRSMYELPWL